MTAFAVALLILFGVSCAVFLLTFYFGGSE